MHMRDIYIYIYTKVKNYLISQSLILPCSLATASTECTSPPTISPPQNDTPVMRPNGVELVGQFLKTVQLGKWTKRIASRFHLLAMAMI